MMVKSLYGIGLTLLLLFAWTCPASSEPYSPSCGLAVEKVIKARKNLSVYQRTVQSARSRERLAYADLAVCARGGIFSVSRAVACNQASWKAPARTKELIEAEEDYRQAKHEFEKSFEYAENSCLLSP
ncbi:hypothetical protein [Candidatus Nitrospira neomarina]|uniref:Uncharacterized protein n=1 Tax=Candidatus Nitrospira neomarina TaxID=3020899 RepID=A0AA96GIC2_9BACT|nr:hypothetical protein [Candidatus Nitrospira neomarina]WNM61867.1 hypothetical protein PQG83_19305 [Candidatus Nitrospira neomarina]